MAPMRPMLNHEGIKGIFSAPAGSLTGTSAGAASSARAPATGAAFSSGLTAGSAGAFAVGGVDLAPVFLYFFFLLLAKARDNRVASAIAILRGVE